jgi:hypothetical protein
MLTKNWTWQAKQSIPPSTVTFYGDCVKMCQDFAPNNWLLHHDNAPYHSFIFHQGILTNTNLAIVPDPPYFSLYPRLRIKLKGRHFDTVEVMESESQAVLNTLTEHDFQDAFKKWQKRCERCIRAEEWLLRR